MPAKNIIREYAPYNYYHVYNRGVAKQPIFCDQADKRYFLSLIARHLDPASGLIDKRGLPYKKFDDSLELLAYCLMGNHFHFLFYLEESETALRDFMHGIGTAYTMYFNLKYKRVGPLFQGAFKASRITSDIYLQHISRYIHLNPRHFEIYRYSSLPIYLGRRQSPPWLHSKRILDLFPRGSYGDFVRDYVEHKEMLDIIKHELADK